MSHVISWWQKIIPIYLKVMKGSQLSPLQKIWKTEFGKILEEQNISLMLHKCLTEATPVHSPKFPGMRYAMSCRFLEFM